MTLVELLNKAKEAYPPLANAYDAETGGPDDQCIDSTAVVLYDALSSHYEPEASDGDQCRLAVGNLRAVIGGLERVIDALESEVPKYIVDGKDTRAWVLIEGRMVHPTPFQTEHSMIGYLLSGAGFVCLRCGLMHDLVAEQSAAVYPINVIPYSQRCAECGTDIVVGWDCQLFEKEPKS